MRRIASTLLAPAALCAALVAAPVLAQHNRVAPQERKAVAERVRLNREQAERAQHQIAEMEASQKAHDAAQSKLDMDEKMYGEARREYPDLQRRYEAAKVDWQKAVDACAHRDLVNCPTANQTPKP